MATPVTAAPASITSLVSVKVIEGPVSMLRKWTVVAVMWIKAVIHVAVEAMWAMEPRAGSYKDASAKPLRPVVPVWGAAVWSVVEITVWTNRRHADIDGDLGRCWAWDAQHSDGQENKY
jgi:hypothetical protein